MYMERISTEQIEAMKNRIKIGDRIYYPMEAGIWERNGNRTKTRWMAGKVVRKYPNLVQIELIGRGGLPIRTIKYSDIATDGRYLDKQSLHEEGTL